MEYGVSDWLLRGKVTNCLRGGVGEKCRHEVVARVGDEKGSVIFSWSLFD